MSKKSFFFLLFLFSFTLGFGQELRLERAFFSTKWEDYGPRIVGDKFYCISASFFGDSTLNDPYTLKPFSDVYVLNDSVIGHAYFTTHRYGDSTSMSSNFYDGPLSGNHNIIFFTNNHGYDHNVRLGIFYAILIDGKWTDAMVFPFNSLDYNVSHPFYDEKNGKLYFTMDENSVEINQDIYVCTFNGREFGLPDKVTVTCSEMNEITPLIYKDTLYFASAGFNTMGGYDLFKVVNDEVVNLGPEFNSIYDDLGIMYDSDTSGYFASDRYSFGEDDDIVRFYYIPDPNKPREQITPIDPLNPVIASTKPKLTALEQLIAAKQDVDDLKKEALAVGVSPDIFAFLNLAMAPYQNNFPQSFADKDDDEILPKIDQLQTILVLIQQQIDLIRPKAPELPKGPVAKPDEVASFGDAPATIDVLKNDTPNTAGIDPTSIDLDPAQPGIQPTVTTPQGTWFVDKGKVNFRPAKGFNGPASIPYTVSDNNGVPSNVALITVNVTIVVLPPIANNDDATTTPNRSVVIPISANDRSPKSKLDLTSIDLDPSKPGQQPVYENPQGLWTAGNGNLTYKPTPKFTGTAFIPYTIKDVDGLESNTAVVTVQVDTKEALEELNKPKPIIANNDFATTDVDTPVSIDVLKNDKEPLAKIDPTSIDLDPSTPGIQQRITTPQGTWTVDNGIVNFDPAPGFKGQATIPYTVNSTDGKPSNIATISVKVEPQPKIPVAKDDFATTMMDVPVNIPVADNDKGKGNPLDLTKVDLDPITPGIQNFFTTPQGTWAANNGVVKFSPVKGFTGPASLPYNISDTKGTPSNVALITVDVVKEILPPVANNDDVTAPKDAPIVIDPLANDSSPFSPLDPNSIDLDPTQPGIQPTITNPQGTWTVDNGKINFKPNKGFTGPATIPYTVSDKKGNPSNVALITVDVIDPIKPPVANNDQASTTPNTPVTFPIDKNDSSPESKLNIPTIDLDPIKPGLQPTLVNPQGNWSVKDGNLTYMPALNFTGTAFITYTIKDIVGLESNVATITVLVAPADVLAAELAKPKPPVANNDMATTKMNVPVTITPLENDKDPLAKLDPTTIDLNPGSPENPQTVKTPQGTWNLGNNGDVTFTPTPDFTGLANIPYLVKNTKGTPSNIATISVRVDPTPKTPLANNDFAQTQKGIPVNIPASSNDVPNGSPLDLMKIDLDPINPGIQKKMSNPQGVWTTVGTAGLVNFAPSPNFVGTATLPYVIYDVKGARSNIALINVKIIDPQSANSDKINLDVMNTIIDQSKIENIHFAFDRYEILPEYQVYLRGLSMLFSANPQWQIHLSGHTDSCGTEEYNINLSRNRSISAKAMIVSCGISADRVTYEYHGEEIHIASNSTPEGRYQNRRVEIAVFVNGKALYNTGVPSANKRE